MQLITPGKILQYRTILRCADFGFARCVCCAIRPIDDGPVWELPAAGLNLGLLQLVQRDPGVCSRCPFQLGFGFLFAWAAEPRAFCPAVVLRFALHAGAYVGPRGGPFLPRGRRC